MIPTHHKRVFSFNFAICKFAQGELTPPPALPSGRILMMNPPQLAAEILPKYFRHSRFSSFQRQLNNFGFKKIEGKGKLTPCMYVAMPFMRSMPRGIVCIACGLVTNEPRFFFLQCYSFASQLWTRRATRAGASVCVIGSP